MNRRPIRFRVIMGYAGLVTAVFLLFGIALYQVLRRYLENAIKYTLSHSLISRTPKLTVSKAKLRWTTANATAAALKWSYPWRH
jgi:hypothetical protein